MEKQRKFLKVGFVITVVIFFIAGGIAFGAGQIPSEDGVFYGCYVTHANDNEPQGQLRVVSSPAECRNNETPIQWNQVGPAGPQGEPGPIGPQGIPGDQLLFGQTCPEETYMTGITADGYIICNQLPTGGGGDPPSPNVCGNGIVEFPESCDDGNTSSFDGCSSSCVVEDSCGSAETSCGSYCADLSNDPYNCGGCGNACGPGAVCSQGSCTLP